MKTIGRSPENLDAVLLTHEHSDHIQGVGPLARKYGLPVYSTNGTRRSSQASVGKIKTWNEFKTEDRFAVDDLEIESYSTPHDAAESVAFVVRHKGRKLGHATDLGCVTEKVLETLSESDVLLVEANHDEELLDSGPYPWKVKRRIKSDQGHLSNRACASMISQLNHANLQMIALMHLSETNNHPEIAQLVARQALKNDQIPMILATQKQPSPLFEIQ